MKIREVNRTLAELGIYSKRKMTQSEYAKIDDKDFIHDWIVEDYSTEGNKEYQLISNDGMTPNEVSVALLTKNTQAVCSIKKMVKFFVVLTVINLVASLYFLIQLVTVFS